MDLIAQPRFPHVRLRFHSCVFFPPPENNQSVVEVDVGEQSSFHAHFSLFPALAAVVNKGLTKLTKVVHEFINQLWSTLFNLILLALINPIVSAISDRPIFGIF